MIGSPKELHRSTRLLPMSEAIDRGPQVVLKDTVNHTAAKRYVCYDSDDLPWPERLCGPASIPI